MNTHHKNIVYSVFMPMEVENQLDECFSPGDGITAIEQVHGELPLLHRPSRLSPLLANFTHLYRARFAWADVGITYIQVRNTLFVTGLWSERDWGRLTHRSVHVVLGNGIMERRLP